MEVDTYARDRLRVSLGSDGMRRDGRRRYDDDSKLTLVKACLRPGVSLAGMALKHGVNANLLRKWVVGH
jgi:transposase